METLAQSVSQLQAKKEVIERELADVHSRIRGIERALNGDSQEERRANSHLEAAQSGATASEGAKTRGTVTKSRKLHRWFEAGEAVGPMKRHVRTPMPTAEIVKLLTRTKGHDKGLAPEKLKRFQASAYMAVANAVKGGAAMRLKDGRIRLRKGQWCQAPQRAFV